MYKEDIILKAAIELNAEYVYELKRGTMGPTLYIRAPDRETAHKIRAHVAGTFEGCYTIVTYTYDSDILDERW